MGQSIFSDEYMYQRKINSHYVRTNIFFGLDQSFESVIHELKKVFCKDKL